MVMYYVRWSARAITIATGIVFSGRPCINAAAKSKNPADLVGKQGARKETSTYNTLCRPQRSAQQARKKIPGETWPPVPGRMQAA